MLDKCLRNACLSRRTLKIWVKKEGKTQLSLVDTEKVMISCDIYVFFAE